MLPIAICDDQRLHGLQTEKVILQCAQAHEPETRFFETSDALLQAIRQDGYAPRIAILDIRMDGMDGITLAQQINALLPSCAVIFLTAYLEYVSDVYESRHVYFILKEQLEQRIGAAIEKALAPQEGVPALCCPFGAERRKVPCSQILYIERILRRTKLQCLSGAEFVCAAPAKLLDGAAGEWFIRCHQSYWVNFQHIAQLEKNEFILSEGTRIPLSRTYRSAAKERFFACMRTMRLPRQPCPPEEQQEPQP